MEAFLIILTSILVILGVGISLWTYFDTRRKSRETDFTRDNFIYMHDKSKTDYEVIKLDGKATYDFGYILPDDSCCLCSKDKLRDRRVFSEK